MGISKTRSKKVKKKKKKKPFVKIMKFWGKHSLTEPSHNLCQKTVINAQEAVGERGGRLNCGLAQEIIVNDPSLVYIHIAFSVT